MKKAEIYILFTILFLRLAYIVGRVFFGYRIPGFQEIWGYLVDLMFIYFSFKYLSISKKNLKTPVMAIRLPEKWRVGKSAVLPGKISFYGIPS